MHFILIPCWGLMPWNVHHSTVKGSCPGTPCRSILEGWCPVNALTIQIVEDSCPGMPCNSNALNGTTCICIVALSLFVVVSLYSRCRWLSCCCYCCWLNLKVMIMLWNLKYILLLKYLLIFRVLDSIDEVYVIIIVCESHPFCLKMLPFVWVTCRWSRIVEVVAHVS